MSHPSKLLARRAMHGLREQISSLYERKTTCDKPGGRYVAKMTPVGFEPTPFRHGASSHRLRPLGQSVHVACGQIILAHVPANGDQEVCRLKIKPVFHICVILRRCRFVFLWLFDVSGQAIIGGDCGADPDSLTLGI